MPAPTSPMHVRARAATLRSAPTRNAVFALGSPPAPVPRPRSSSSARRRSRSTSRRATPRAHGREASRSRPARPSAPGSSSRSRSTRPTSSASSGRATRRAVLRRGARGERQLVDRPTVGAADTGADAGTPDAAQGRRSRAARLRSRSPSTVRATSGSPSQSGTVSDVSVAAVNSNPVARRRVRRARSGRCSRASTGPTATRTQSRLFVLAALLGAIAFGWSPWRRHRRGLSQRRAPRPRGHRARRLPAAGAAPRQPGVHTRQRATADHLREPTGVRVPFDVRLPPSIASHLAVRGGAPHRLAEHRQRRRTARHVSRASRRTTWARWATATSRTTS